MNIIMKYRYMMPSDLLNFLLNAYTIYKTFIQGKDFIVRPMMNIWECDYSLLYSYILISLFTC